jgi:MarR family transcriptional regulator, 2-MHQ and catechol-resistance regulon repressor
MDRRQKRALELYVKLSRASAAFSNHLRPGLEADGLSESQMGVLDALYHVGPMTQRELAAKVLRSPANMTAVLDQLGRRGLVSRERGEDRRTNVIALTSQGRELFERIFAPHAARIADAAGVLTGPEQSELARLCRKLGLALLARSGISNEGSRAK